jgi:Flp pilus assembly protein TadB
MSASDEPRILRVRTLSELDEEHPMPSRGWDGRRIFRLIWALLALAFVVFVAMVAPAWLMAILPFGFTRYIMANVAFAI